MRRRLGTLIPIVLFAVLVQFLAPIGAFRAAAVAVSDPLAVASICSGMTDSDQGPADKTHAADCCAFCAAGHGGSVAALDAPPVIFVRLQRQYQRVVWLEAISAAPRGRAGSNAQARAPPTLS